MTTVASRTFACTPSRDTMDTWQRIVDLLTQGKSGTARNELLAVSGVASSLLADKAPQNAPIVVTCDGPRTRIYCVYDDDAIDGSDANEDALGFDPLAGEWRVSLPCLADDLAWVEGALKKHSSRITARDLSADVEKAAAAPNAQAGLLVLDPKGFLGQ